MPPQITCASALPGKTWKHEYHTFHSIGLCYTHNAPVHCLPERKKMSSVMCLIASNTCWGSKIYPVNTVHWLLLQAWRRTTPTFCTATDSMTDLANTEHVSNTQQDAMLLSWVLSGAPTRSFWQQSVVQLWPGDIFNCVLCFWWKSMQHLSEKTQFPGFLFPQVVQKH